MRLFNVTIDKPTLVGDPSPSFALSSFVPEKYAPLTNKVSDLGWRFGNLCGLINRI